MEKKDVVAAVTALKDSDKRKFPQSYELIINIKNIDLKNQQNQLDGKLNALQSHLMRIEAQLYRMQTK